ncbi:putative nucleotidyltransferase substrate binding domain-containing protein [Marinomonas primoryensis]|jgi:CBS domain-containing protein|uniref:putative nucleotidyltransferase substrate binding domain-containing protein n=1 Tax=Marinomonas primoryensis TaxID=178399 RepID=UPI003704CA78
MDVELTEILEALCQHSPFNEIAEDPQLNDMTKEIEIQYVRAGEWVIAPSALNNTLFFIRSGAIEVLSKEEKLIRRMNEGELFGYASLLRGGKSSQSMRTIEDSLLYCIPARWFLKLYEENDTFSDFFQLAREVRLRVAMDSRSSDVSLMTCPVISLLRRPPISTHIDSDIRLAAQIMSEHRVSSLLITDNDELIGIVTDRDLRTRAVAKGLAYDTPISSIMTRDPIVMDSRDYASEAVLKMMACNVHHIPIIKNGRPIGVVSTGDIIQKESHGSVYLISDIFKQSNIEGLQAISHKMTHTFNQLVVADANTQMIGNAMTHIGTAFVKRLLQLGEEKFGPAPVPYCFIALGSQAREEQTIKTDQDNALILSDKYDESLHWEYFKNLSDWVCKNLDLCGYTLCTGDIMASNLRWRQPLNVWKENFSEWIQKPKAEALLRLSIFFDLRGIYGDKTLAKQLNQHIRKEAKQHSGFLTFMARNANQRKPPLGFFRQFVLDGEGKQSRTFNLKERGIAPIIDIVRVHALACGSDKLNTLERIEDIEAAGLLPDGRAKDLALALEMIGMVRIQNQKDQIEAGEEPNNNVNPENLSSFEKRHLRDAFHIVSRQQEFIKFRYAGKRS